MHAALLQLFWVVHRATNSLSHPTCPVSHSKKVPEPEFELRLHKERIRPVRSLGSRIVPAGSRTMGTMEVPGGKHAAPCLTLYSPGLWVTGMGD